MARINMNGITTVVDLSETDGLTRSVKNLYAKTHALCEHWFRHLWQTYLS